MSDGLVVVDKPGGWTSHQVVGRLRRILGTRKIGHAGTLDPMATGVLLAGVGRATRLLGHLSLSDKSYTATIRLGQATTTDDAEGEVTSAPGAAGVGTGAVEAAMGRYRGSITQVPSTVSAIKVDGQRAYTRARRGEQVVLTGREVTVSRFALVASRSGEAGGVPVLDLDVEVDCSSGTYIRALARDLGADLGTGGHLTALRRTRVGGFGLDEPHLRPSDLTAESVAVPLLPLAEVARRCFPVVEVDEAAAADVRHGRPLEIPADAKVRGDDPPRTPRGLARFPSPLGGPNPPNGVFAVLCEGEFLALYRPEGGRFVPVAVFVT